MARLASLHLDQIHAHDLRCTIDMPRETINIPLKSLAVYEASAVFFSTIAYPDPLDETQREKFRIALSRWAILQRATIDGQWGGVAQAIKPEIFSQRERPFLQSYKRGLDLIRRRVICAAAIVGPHLLETPLRLRGLEPTVGNLSLIVADALGMSSESQKTVESRLWAPTKPIAHAVLVWGFYLLRASINKVTWAHENQLCNHDLFLSAFFYPEIVTLLVERAEKIRLRLPGIKCFHIKEENTIQFALD
jgi:hypothetical protein